MVAFKLQISERQPDRERVREREGAQIISANTNMVNGSKMEFTRVGCSARTAQKIVALNQADLNGNGEGGTTNSCFSQKTLHGPPAGQRAVTGRKAPH